MVGAAAAEAAAVVIVAVAVVLVVQTHFTFIKNTCISFLVNKWVLRADSRA